MNPDFSGSTNPRDADAWKAARAQYRDNLPPNELEVTLLARFGEARVSAVAAGQAVVPKPKAARWYWPAWLEWNG